MTNDNPKSNCCGAEIYWHHKGGVKYLMHCSNCDNPCTDKPSPAPKCEHDKGDYWMKDGVSCLKENYPCPFCKPVETSVDNHCHHGVPKDICVECHCAEKKVESSVEDEAMMIADRLIDHVYFNRQADILFGEGVLKDAKRFKELRNERNRK